MKSISMIKKETKTTLKPPRKSRTKIKKPKFISLRLQLSPENTSHQPHQMPADHDRHHHKHQLDLFPLHPENLVEDKDTQDEDMACFFSTADGGATTLTGLLEATSCSASEEDNRKATNDHLSAESLTYAYGGQDNEEGDRELVRTAMRNKERELSSEEKWVCYSEVTISSSHVSDHDLRCKEDHDEKKKMVIQRQRLSLKLDYQEIMNSWSDNNIHLDSPQVVPDLHDDDFFGHPTTSNGWGIKGGLWRVPEMSGNKTNNGFIKGEEVQGGGGGEEWKLGHREASVLRYKEKRQNRLFSKKIRYEVRKLNAEKRPRIKGRFVKRN